MTATTGTEVTKTPGRARRRRLLLAIQQYSGRPLAELAVGASREASKQELLEKIRAAYHEEVVDIHLTQFVMQ